MSERHFESGSSKRKRNKEDTAAALKNVMTLKSYFKSVVSDEAETEDEEPGSDVDSSSVLEENPESYSVLEAVVGHLPSTAHP